MSFYKRNIIGGITLFTIISSSIIYENILRFKKGPPPLEPDPYDFAYNYVEIGFLENLILLKKASYLNRSVADAILSPFLQERKKVQGVYL